MSKFTRFLRDESGATAIEYGLIAAGIAVAIIAVVQGIGTNLTGTFGSVQTALKEKPARVSPASRHAQAARRTPRARSP
jgi:pilus assembly protein Flp/PilA